MIETRILLAPALATLDRVAEAATGLDEAAAILTEHPDAGRLPDWHHEAMRNLRLASRPEPSHELSDAERRILRLLSSDLSLREIGRELYLSQNTVKSHVHSIYRKLGVSGRADAVRAARIRTPTGPGDSPG
jgi:LuxR family maltose regulon positive regulatory protein